MINLKCDCIEELINASQGYVDNNTVFKNIKILNVFTKEWALAHVYIYKKWISHVEYDVDKPLMKCKNIIDGLIPLMDELKIEKLTDIIGRSHQYD